MYQYNKIPVVFGLGENNYLNLNKLSELLHSDMTYHVVLKALCEKEEQGFNELFRYSGELRKKLLPNKGILSKDIYYECIKNLLDIGAISRNQDPTHSQRWLYRVELSLRKELEILFKEVEAFGYFNTVDETERFFRNISPDEAVQHLGEYGVFNILSAYNYCAKNPAFAEYRLFLTLLHLEILGLSFSKLCANADVITRTKYLSAMDILISKMSKISGVRR